MDSKTQLSDLVCLDDVEERALAILPKSVRGYYESGADDEQTVRANRKAFKKSVRSIEWSIIIIIIIIEISR